MRNELPRLAISVVALIAVALLSGSVNSSRAQQPGQAGSMPPALERREAEMAREREIRQREELRRSLGKKPVRAANLRYVQAVIAQVKQDFERIQIARNEIVRAAASGNALDYKFLSEVTGDIKKRAGRLEDNLALPEPEEDKNNTNDAGELSEAQIKEALSTLCNRIESFVRSPLFETPGVIDVEHSTKASSDLRTILELSGRIKKNAERLSKKP